MAGDSIRGDFTNLLFVFVRIRNRRQLEFIRRKDLKVIKVQDFHSISYFIAISILSRSKEKDQAK